MIFPFENWQILIKISKRPFIKHEPRRSRLHGLLRTPFFHDRAPFVPCRSISTFKKSTIKINPLKLLKTYSEHAPNIARGAKIRLKNIKMFRNDQNHNKETLAFDHMLCDQFRENLGGVFLRRLILYPQYKMRRNDRYSTVNDASHRVLYRSFRRISYWGYSMRRLRNTPPNPSSHTRSFSTR